MKGVGFAQHVNEWLKAHGEAAGKVAVIQANPEQSKHLETATVRLHGELVDLVNLRAEEYTESSRIPTMVGRHACLRRIVLTRTRVCVRVCACNTHVCVRVCCVCDQRIGTAYEDAFRRDFTVNSLFYNVTIGFVEDFTGRVRWCWVAPPEASDVVSDGLCALRCRE